MRGKMFKRVLIAIVLCILTVLLLCSCGDKGFRSSFLAPNTNQTGRFSDGGLICDIIAEKTQYNIDEVYLDYYFGHITGIDNYIEAMEESGLYTFVSVALYFQEYSAQEKYIFSASSPGVEDYKNIEGAYFLKEFSYSEFYSEKYQVKRRKNIETFNNVLTYNHNERIKVPPQIFNGEKQGFVFFLCGVYLVKETGEYSFGAIGALETYFEKTETNTVKLSL